MTISEATHNREGIIDAIDRACALLGAAPPHDQARAIREAIGILQAARRGESSLARSIEALQQQNTRLRRALANAKEEIRGRDDFLAVVTHELRNPLAPLSFAIDLLLTEASQDRLPKGEVLMRRLGILRRQVGRLTADLNRLLDFSRIRGGRLDLRLEDVDLTEVVAEVLQEMKPQLDTSRCELRWSCPAPQRGRWDPMRLRQVVWNLISNATKFGAGAPIDVAVTSDDYEVRLSVRDRGPGIPKEERERVFKRFERCSVHPHTGFGVGLWLVKQIVDAMGGTVRLYSEVGRGTTFTVTLPRNYDG